MKPLLFALHLFVAALTCLCLFSCAASSSTRKPGKIAIGSGFIDNNRFAKEKSKTFTYYWNTNKNQKVVLLFDSTNIGMGDNFKFVEFLQVVPLQPLNYTFDIRFRKARPLKNGMQYKDFYIYNFKVVMPRLII